MSNGTVAGRMVNRNWRGEFHAFDQLDLRHVKI